MEEMGLDQEKIGLEQEKMGLEQTQDESNEQIVLRKAKLNKLRGERYPYPNNFRPTHWAQDLFIQFEGKSPEELEDLEKQATSVPVKVAGRMMTRRLMGKASFVNLQDRSGKIQLYVKQDIVGNEIYEAFLDFDLGDIIGVSGTMFKTKTGELSIKVGDLSLLTKALRPLPDKWHGLTDQEIRYRQRYVDLMVNKEVQAAFIIRSETVYAFREFLRSNQFIEVETPMMQVIPGGATARPFITHHNALSMDLYLRVAPELYLKRLVVGGFERVFEINRNFRNEGLSTRHNPEFTMLEFYQAYADYLDFMDFTENLLRGVVQRVMGKLQIEYQGIQIDFEKPFERLTIKQAILKYMPELSAKDIENRITLEKMLHQHGIPIVGSHGIGRLQLMLFEEKIEEKLLQPTFIMEYPIEASPLARSNEKNKEVADRAELYIAGREVANLFSELNDPEDQAQRFLKQAQDKAAGDQEAMHYDADYITALEYGLPPCAGCGVGIDRFVMVLTDSPSIRDVILFPHMRPT